MSYQLPVYSPLPFSALLAGAAGLRRRNDAPGHVVELLRSRFGAADVLLTDSGTTALRLALAWAAGRHPGRPVALPAYSCYDVATAATGAGVPVVLYDLDPRTLGPDFDSLTRVVRNGISCVVTAPLYGVPIDVDAVRHLTGAAGVPLIEDAAQGVGAGWGGRPVGCSGDLTVLSFGRGKGVTGAGGGALLTPSAAFAPVLSELSRGLPLGGRGVRPLLAATSQWLLGRPGWYALPAALPFLHLGETIYRPPRPPRGMPAAVVRMLGTTWPLAERETAMRRQHAARLLQAFPGTLGRPKVPARGEAGWLRLPALTAAPARGRIAQAAALGVTAGYPAALADLPGFGPVARGDGENYSGARLLAERLFTLPVHSRLREADLERLENWLRGWR